MYETGLKMLSKTSLCLMILYIIEFTCASYRNYYVTNVSELNDLAISSGEYMITTLNTVSGVKECMISCTNQDICMTFGYNADTRDCKLYSTHFLSALNATESPGWRYYERGIANCPEHLGFVHVNNLCAHYSTNAFNYTGGKAYCESLQAVPIHLETEEKRQNLKIILDQLKSTDESNVIGFRIGLIKAGNSWVWDGGEEETSMNWIPGQPDCDNCECVRIWSNRAWKGADYECEILQEIICEYL